MPFLFGPVLPVELVTTARRRRHYVVRALYALVFLLTLAAQYQNRGQFAGRSMSIDAMAEFAQTFFIIFSFTQLTAVLLLTPAYVAPSLADEKERRTLEYLFTTDLRNREIVLGKLAVRLGHIFLYILAGVPILSISTWFGGVSFELLLQMYLLTGMTAVAVGCASMLASVYSRRVRDGVVLTYVAGLGWLVIPVLMRALLWSVRGGPGPLPQVVDYVFALVMLTNPYAVWGQGLLSGVGPWTTLGYSLLALGVFAVVCLMLSVLRVRQVYVKQMHGRQKRSGRFAKEPRISRIVRLLHAIGLDDLARGIQRVRYPPVGERPMLWKELYAAENVRGGRIAGFIVALFGVGLLAWCGWYLVQALSEPWVASRYTWPREEMNILIRVAGTAMGMLGLLAVSVRAATSVTGERERETWDGLVCTVLEPRQIVLAKLAGALWAGRWFCVLLLACWMMGVLAGSLHLMGLAAMGVELGVYAFFLAALGLRCSLGMKRSGRALATVLGIGLFLGGGYLMCCAPFAFGMDPHTGPIFLGASFPVVVGFSGATPEELVEFLRDGDESMVSLAVGAVVMLAVYFSAGVALVAASIADFDRLSGRVTGMHRGAAGWPRDAAKAPGGQAEAAAAGNDSEAKEEAVRKKANNRK